MEVPPEPVFPWASQAILVFGKVCESPVGREPEADVGHCLASLLSHLPANALLTLKQKQNKNEIPEYFSQRTVAKFG